MKTLDITCTSCLRPEILDRTYKSFKQRMFKDYPCRLLLNIDPVGDGEAMDIYAIAQRYFPKVIVSMPLKPSLPVAFKWCWDTFNADYLFHLEDDWELLRECPIEDMIAQMDRMPDLASLRLSLWDSQDDYVRAVYCSKAEHNNIPWNAQDGFFEVQDWNKHRLGTSGHPSLYNGTFIRQIRQILSEEMNPEKLLRLHPYAKALQKKWRFGVYGKPNELAIIKDIGKTYCKDHHLIKTGGIPGNKEMFTYWSKDEDLS